MKEATGELNMTVIVVIAIAAVAALFYAFIWPQIQKSLVNNTCKTYGSGYTASKSNAYDSTTGATVNRWQCCRNGTCVDAQ